MPKIVGNGIRIEYVISSIRRDTAQRDCKGCQGKVIIYKLKMVNFRLNIGNKKEHIGMPGVKHQIPDPNDAVIKAVAHKIHQKRKVGNSSSV